MAHFYWLPLREFNVYKQCRAPESQGLSCGSCGSTSKALAILETTKKLMEGLMLAILLWKTQPCRRARVALFRFSKTRVVWAITQKALLATEAPKCSYMGCALPKGFLMSERGPHSSIATETAPEIIRTQIKSSQIYQSATIVSEQAVSLLFCAWS